ncbi:peptide/nickel transport system ATP-binding protein [Agromyces terreus]|uniref:Peptide/nickel transport system ATP-binding protein n=1 Tax=Agromyces terreus TaxID=424795 RepID=A0A9X2GXS4_9MICO|nr:ABC transporter ATP-binding protein [Agromyces terreus]MCP2371025.1 peptide/nickel transport system ATP-binding protein [Agromyces terreus]
MTAVSIHARGLTVLAPDGRTMVQPLDLDLVGGETVALIGESGSGKTLTAKSLIGLLPPGFRAQGEVRYGEQAFELSMPDAAWRPLRGRTVSLLLQDPFTSLSPVHRCGEQIAWTIEAATGRRLRGAARTSAIAARLAEVRLPERVARAYPHELSGGMRQRVAIAAALASDPVLLIADEPTTALDASNQAEILDLLHGIQTARGMAVLLISHDLGLVRGRTDRVLVMRSGEIVERGDTATVLAAPEHAYTRALIEVDPAMRALAADDGSTADGSADDGSTPALAAGTDRPTAVLEASGIVKRFGERTVLDDVSIALRPGEVTGVVGESGSGKSTLARCIAGLEREDGGEIRFEGVVLAPGRGSRTPAQMQIVFQDPYSSLNPMMSIGAILREALHVARRPAADVAVLLETVGLPADFAGKRPAQLSGGQRQRVAIARALAPRPSVLICDESVSALDVSVQAQVLALLAQLRDELGLAILFISHDLAVVREIADTVTVLWDGRVVEQGECARVLTAPEHEYTRLLIAAGRRENPRAAASDLASKGTR